MTTSRSLTTAVNNALAAGTVRPVLLIELYFDSATVYHTHNSYDLTWNGHTYTAVGANGTIEPMTESAGFESNGLVGTLVANSVNMALALSENIQGRQAIVRLALLDAGHQIIADPVVVFRGRMDTMKVELGKTATIKLAVESRFAAWDTPRVRRWNHEDQVAEHPGDLFFEFVPQMVQKTIMWGVTDTGAVAAPANNPASTSAALANLMARGIW